MENRVGNIEASVESLNGIAEELQHQQPPRRRPPPPQQQPPWLQGAVPPNHHAQLPPRPRAAARAINVIDALRNDDGRVPASPPTLPATMVELLKEHHVYGLAAFESGTKGTWPQRARIAFSRRMYLYNQILKKKQANLLRGGEDFHRVKMPKAALKLDTEKQQGRSLAKFIVFLKENDPNKKTRKRKVPVVY